MCVCVCVCMVKVGLQLGVCKTGFILLLFLIVQLPMSVYIYTHTHREILRLICILNEKLKLRNMCMSNILLGKFLSLCVGGGVGVASGK